MGAATAHGELAGRTALVTGGASGIGRATAALLSERGARVAVLDRAAVGMPKAWLALEADVRDSASVDSALATLEAELGGLDILVNCAGIGAVGTVDEATDEEWERVLDVNVVGIGRVVRAALPLLRRSTGACIVNVTSIVASVGLPRRAVYSASKGAVLALTYAMATDHLPDGIRVNAVSPGTADTPWVQRLLDQADDPATERRALEARQPSGRLVTADEVAHAILYLVAPTSGSTTGAVLAVDGGVSSLRPRPTG